MNVTTAVPDSSQPSSSPPTHGSDTQRSAFAWLALGALGVAFGDIGTSPLYTLKECIQRRRILCHRGRYLPHPFTHLLLALHRGCLQTPPRPQPGRQQRR